MVHRCHEIRPGYRAPLSITDEHQGYVGKLAKERLKLGQIQSTVQRGDDRRTRLTCQWKTEVVEMTTSKSSRQRWAWPTATVHAEIRSR